MEEKGKAALRSALCAGVVKWAELLWEVSSAATAAEQVARLPTRATKLLEAQHFNSQGGHSSLPHEISHDLHLPARSSE